MSVPAWAYEKAVVVSYDPQWRVRAEAECSRLRSVLAPWLVDGVEHVGSTAVPGLAAKPIVDIMASVTDLDVVVREAVDPLTAAGWCYVPPDLDARPYRRFFVKPDPTTHHRTAHLHILAAGHHRWTDQLTFRDTLRTNPSVAQAYADLKRRLASEYADDREAYTNAKASFIESVPHSGKGNH